MTSFLITLLVFVSALAFLGRRMIRSAMQRRSETQRAQVAGEQCRCGYPLKDLDLGRCPECGRVISFDATPEQLGLTQEELARIAEKRRGRSNISDHHASD